jgi:hypothetical protein
MGFHFGPRTGSRSYTYSSELAAKLAKKGGRNSTGGARLLGIMRGAEGGEPDTLCPEEAEQAARSITEAAKRLRRGDRRIAEQIAADAQAAADAGRRWRIS